MTSHNHLYKELRGTVRCLLIEAVNDRRKPDTLEPAPRRELG